MNAHIDFDPDDEQVMSLDQWLARQRAELAGHRAQAHAQLDSLFDQHERRLQIDVELMRRAQDGASMMN